VTVLGVFKSPALSTDNINRLNHVRFDKKDYGLALDGVTNDTNAFQAYMAALSANSIMSEELGGVILIDRPITLTSISALRGFGQRFGFTVKVKSTFIGDSVFVIDGGVLQEAHHIDLKNVLISLDDYNNSAGQTLSQVVKIKNCYSVIMDTVEVSNGIGKLMTVENSNHVQINNCKLFGRDVSSASEAIHVINNSNVTIFEPDVEVCFRGILVEGNSTVTIHGGHGERCIVGWKSSPSSTGQVTVTGGKWESPGSSGIAAHIDTGYTTVIGGNYIANGGSGLYINPAVNPPKTKVIAPHGSINNAGNWPGIIL
jgi:hypothetical protein